MYRITITAGTMFDGAGQRMVNAGAALERIRHSLAMSAGGYTEQDSFGGWVKDGQIVTEPGKRFTVLSPSDAGAHDMAAMVARELHQNAVALEVEELRQAEIVAA